MIVSSLSSSSSNSSRQVTRSPTLNSVITSSLVFLEPPAAQLPTHRIPISIDHLDREKLRVQCDRCQIRAHLIYDVRRRAVLLAPPLSQNAVSRRETRGPFNLITDAELCLSVHCLFPFGLKVCG